jgi:membrane-bound lytic murein transglycosylase A
MERPCCFKRLALSSFMGIAMRRLAGLVTGLALGLAGGVAMGAELPVVPPVPQPVAKPVAVLRPVEVDPSIGLDEQVMADRPSLLAAIDRSLNYLGGVSGRYSAVPGVTADRARRSLRRFRQLLVSSKTAEQLQTSVRQEFEWYESSGSDGQGKVDFTGYFEPVHVASRQRTETYRYPIYRLPSGFDSWGKPHPTRAQLEGADGLQASSGKLRGAELVWLADRLEAYLIQVQGSSRLQMTDGSSLSIGYAGHTDYPYKGIGRELVKDGKLQLEELNLPNIKAYFQQNPQDLDIYLPRNQRFVFFQNTHGSPAMGSIGVAVTAERSIATDKRVMPAGALALIYTQLPIAAGAGQYTQQQVSRFVLDQDTGGAIVGPGRVDVFMGTGSVAGERAGLIRAPGKLYYLLLKGAQKAR